jgi:hypothetical protein
MYVSSVDVPVACISEGFDWPRWGRKGTERCHVWQATQAAEYVLHDLQRALASGRGRIENQVATKAAAHRIEAAASAILRLI